MYHARSDCPWMRRELRACAWRRGDALPEAKPTTRLMLVGDQHIGLLSAMFVAHGGLGEPLCTLLCCACSGVTPCNS